MILTTIFGTQQLCRRFDEASLNDTTMHTEQHVPIKRYLRHSPRVNLSFVAGWAGRTLRQGEFSVYVKISTNLQVPSAPDRHREAIPDMVCLSLTIISIVDEHNSYREIIFSAFFGRCSGDFIMGASAAAVDGNTDLNTSKWSASRHLSRERILWSFINLV